MQYATVDREASRFSDYTSASGTVSFAVGESEKTVRVPITRDAVVENTEAFSLNLSNATSASIARGQATAFIRDNDAPVGVPNVSVFDVTLDERGRQAVFAVSLDRPAGALVSVNFATTDITAIAGFDFTATSGTLTFAPGQTLLTVAVPILDDADVEALESFELRLSSPTGAALGRSAATGLIAASDAAPQSNPLITVRGGSAGEADGFVEFVIELSAPSDRVVTVTASTTDITASRFSDLVATSVVLAFDPGETARVLRVPITNDTAVERTEIFSMGLSSPVNAVAGGDGYGLIHDNDANTGSVVISAHDVVIDEGASFARVLLTLDRPGAVPVSVNFATGSGTALSEVDYAGTEKTVIFAPGQTVQTV